MIVNLGNRALVNRALSRQLARASGFTIIELMVVLALMGAVLAIGVPAFQNTVKNNRLAGEVSALRTSIANARSEALARRMPVIMCESDNAADAGASCSSNSAWTTGYIAYVDADNSETLDSGEDIFLSLDVDVPNDVSIIFRRPDGTVTRDIRFSSRGDSINSSGTFTFCDNRGAGDARALILEPSGVVRSAIDRDDPEDGVVEDFGGVANVVCP